MKQVIGSNRPIPKRFWRDEQWALDHYGELAKRYKKRCWVAVVNRRVVAVSKSSVKAQLRAQAKTGLSHVPVVFIEHGWHIY